MIHFAKASHFFTNRNCRTRAVSDPIHRHT